MCPHWVHVLCLLFLPELSSLTRSFQIFNIKFVKVSFISLRSVKLIESVFLRAFEVRSGSKAYMQPMFYITG